MNEFSDLIKFDLETDFDEAVEFVYLVRCLHRGEEIELNEIKKTFKRAFSEALKGTHNMPNFEIEDGEFIIIIHKNGSQSHNLARFLRFHGFCKVYEEIETMHWSL